MIRADRLVKEFGWAFIAWNAIGLLGCAIALRWAIHDATKHDWTKP